jgi:rod shape-determining protein MreC
MHSAKSGLTNSDLLIGIIIGVLLILFSRIGVFNPLYSYFGNIFGDFQTTNLVNFQSFSNDWAFFWNLSGIKSENDQLRQENLALTDAKIQLQEQINDLNKQLKQQQDFDLKYQLEPVRVVRYLDSQSEIIINKGSASNFKIGLPVVLGKDLVGVITEVLDTSARVKLITDPGISLPVVLLQSNTKGFIKGDGANGITLSEVPNNIKIIVADQVLTSGNDTGIPYGLIVGEVAGVTSDPAKVTQVAELRSQINFNNLNELFVVIN